MKKQKPALLKGTRDFAPEVMIKRNFILDQIKDTFRKYGFLPLETPSIERLDVLTGKYGEEGDQLIFKILNSGDFLDKIAEQELAEGYKKLIPKISKRALRYDLTVPFARFVSMNRGEINFPFKRFQIQPVWRGDRPQKGRYQEFYQCDADVVGTNSLLCEAEIILMIHEVFARLGIQNYDLKINNRKILSGLAEIMDEKDRQGDLFVALDKLDKIGLEQVIEELKNKGFSDQALAHLEPVLNPSEQGQLDYLKTAFQHSEVGQKGIQEIEEIMQLVSTYTGESNLTETHHLQLDLTLARGLTYYTGAIFEVKSTEVSIGSLVGGGRYDDLTGIFGLPDMSGVGFSFGIDRLYDVMDELGLFPEDAGLSTHVMFVNFDENAQNYILPLLHKFRQAGLNCEIYPEAAKLKKQMNYANAKQIPYVILVGSEEMQTNKLSLKNMESGEQQKLTYAEIITQLKEQLL